ncbi:MAG: hypothetical protein ALMCE001_02420 [Methanocorpusculum sp. MCE]|nr:MAG: hypothetical protein ALMCE001_02420 [Methanocorpusculum sp. MCE]
MFFFRGVCDVCIFWFVFLCGGFLIYFHMKTHICVWNIFQRGKGEDYMRGVIVY